MTLHELEESLVYAGYPVIIRSTSPDVNVYIISNVTGTNTADNDLQGTVEEMAVERSDKIYVLLNGSFYLTQGTISDHNAYLNLLSFASAPERLTFNKGDASIIFDTEASGNETDGPWYSISGQRVDQPTKGVFIKNGKKYLFK